MFRVLEHGFGARGRSLGVFVIVAVFVLLYALMVQGQNFDTWWGKSSDGERQEIRQLRRDFAAAESMIAELKSQINELQADLATHRVDRK